MYKRVAEVLDEHQTTRNIRLKPDVKMTLHAYAQQLLFKQVEVKQQEWDHQNKPSMILQQNEAIYTQMIETMLDHGITVHSQGLMIAQSLAGAIQQEALAAASDYRIRGVKGSTWITSSEKVRLKYLKELAEEVSSGDKSRALRFFTNPRDEIEQWFRKQVDRPCNVAKIEDIYTKTYQAAIKSVQRDVSRASSWSKLRSKVKKYQASAGMTVYETPDEISIDSADDLESICNTIVKELLEGYGNTPAVDVSKLKPPSRDDQVMSRLGCTKCCFWCGALCWGERNHDQNMDDTKKHHSSHQPQGLDCTDDKTTHCLLARPCHEVTDDTDAFFGEFLDTGVKWYEVKTKHFNEWKFERHHQTKFDELMRWFFQELHVDIATSNKIYQQAREDDLKKYKCQGLVLNSILVRIEQEIS
jgi:hypothetical protein